MTEYFMWSDGKCYKNGTDPSKIDVPTPVNPTPTPTPTPTTKNIFKLCIKMMISLFLLFN